MEFNFKNDITPSKGCFLISNPLLEEKYFTRSVILLLEHDENGSFGLVINNFIDLKLKEIDKNLPNQSFPISIGGPVEKNSLFILHREDPPLYDSKYIKDNVFFSGNLLQLSKKYEPKNDAYTIRYFMGYSGWSKNQLKEEILDQSWIVCENIPLVDIFDPNIDDFWKHAMHLQGEKYKIMTNFPKNPNHN